MKKSILALSMVALGTSLFSHAATQYAELSKELEIMNSVLATTLKQSSQSEAIRFRGLDTSYLAGQGVVFEITTSRGAWGLGLDLRQFIPAAPEAPIPPIIIGDDGHSVSIEFEESWERVVEESVRGLEEAFRDASEQLRDVRSDSRELSWEMRELERRKRDLDFELRKADEERQREAREELQEIEQALAKLASKQSELEQYASTIESERKAKIAEQQRAREAADKAFLASFEEQVGDALCRFGAGLRALPEDEHISFVLKNFSADSQRQSQDRVYVFAQKSVKSCVQERINASKLLENATVYAF